VKAQLSPEEIKTVMEEVFISHEKRNLLGFELKTQGRGNDCRIVSITLADGRPLDRNKKYDIAFNSFDSRSGGHHFMKLRALLERPEANYVLHPVQTRDALIDYFQRHKIMHRIAAGIPVEIAHKVSAVRSCKENSFRLPISPCGSGFFALLVYC
jgi:hypothetical protein